MYFDLVGTNRYFDVILCKDCVLIDNSFYELSENRIRSGALFIYSISIDKRELRKGPDYDTWLNTPVSFYEWKSRLDKPSKIIIQGTIYDVVGTDIRELKLNDKLVGYLLPHNNSFECIWHNYYPDEMLLTVLNKMDEYLGFP